MELYNVLTIHQITGEIINLIEDAKEYCFLITPYYKPWPILQRALDKAAKLEKKIIFVFRTNDVSIDQIDRLKESGFDIHFVDRLHTKLYLNEKSAIISSMNLYDSSKEFNYEIGYKINRKDEVNKIKEIVIDKDIFGINSEISIPGRYAKSRKNEKVKNDVKSSKNVYKKSIAGYCIRCGIEIDLNPNAPYCKECYQSYSYWSNPDFVEKYCHICGQTKETSMNKPLCKNCYSNQF